MGLKIGIVGLPNVGKSTLFNALTKEQNAQSANYPFCTIEPNKAIVPVPDKRVEVLAELTKAAQTIYATIEFVDVAGLVKGASQGEGLGNQFLGNIRDVDAILHVVRCFDDENVVHVNAKPDPRDDIEVINTELALADLDQLERKIEKMQKQLKAEPELKPVLELARQLVDYLGTGAPLWNFDGRNSDEFDILNKELRFLTAKPVMYAANVDEDSIADENEYVREARAIAAEQDTEVVMVCAKLEQEMAGMSDEERTEFLEMYGVEESGLEKVLRKGYNMLGLISYFTASEKEARAWTIHRGWTAPQAAGVIHTDFEKGFIRAEVIPYETFVEHGNRNSVKSAGQMRVEGKEYVVKDGDTMLFLFNV